MLFCNASKQKPRRFRVSHCYFAFVHLSLTPRNLRLLCFSFPLFFPEPESIPFRFFCVELRANFVSCSFCCNFFLKKKLGFKIGYCCFVGFGGAEDFQEHIPIWISFHFVQPWVCSVLACLFHISVSHVCCDEVAEISHYFLILNRCKPLQIWDKEGT